MYGLQPLPKDPRDLKLGGIFGQPQLHEIPSEFILDGYTIKNQGDSDFCAAFSSTLASEFQEGVSLSPEAVFALSKAESDDVDEWGQDLRTICEVHRKHGAPEKDVVPFSIEDKDPTFLRRITNYPIDQVLKSAIVHKKASYMSTSGNYKPFDNIRAWMWKFRSERKAVILGVNWGWSTSEPFINDLGNGGFGHAVCAIGWTKKNGKDYLIIANSWGESAGDRGLFYLSREVVDHFVERFGAFMFTDIPADEAKWYKENGYKKDVSWLKSILIPLYRLLIDLTVKLMDKKQDRLTLWAEAIKRHEGWFPGSRSQRNQNPGNFKYVGQFKAIGKDKDNFAIFPDYETGWAHLRKVLTNAATGKSKVYNPEMTLVEFFEKYAPSFDDNDPQRYANEVAKYIGVEPITKIKELL